MDKEIISFHIYDEYTKEYAHKWDRPEYQEWLEMKLFNQMYNVKENEIPTSTR